MGLKFSIVAIADVLNRCSFTAAGLHHETIAVNSDTTIHCWLPSSFSKPPLLLLHGFGTPATWQWQAQVRTLSRYFDLIVPDLIFFGGSTTLSPERSEKFQAEAMVALLEKLGIAGKLAWVVGTSYGGFVAYHVARMMGEGWKGKVVIASSDLGKMEEDDRAFRERAGGVKSVEEIMLPSTASGLRQFLKLAFHRPPSFLPEFVLKDVLRRLFVLLCSSRWMKLPRNFIAISCFIALIYMLFGRLVERFIPLLCWETAPPKMEKETKSVKEELATERETTPSEMEKESEPVTEGLAEW